METNAVVVSVDPFVTMSPSEDGKMLSTEQWSVVTAHPDYTKLVELAVKLVKARTAWKKALKEHEEAGTAKNKADAAARIPESHPRVDAVNKALYAAHTQLARLEIDVLVESLRSNKDQAKLALLTAELDQARIKCQQQRVIEKVPTEAQIGAQQFRDAEIELSNAVVALDVAATTLKNFQRCTPLSRFFRFCE